MKIIFLLYYLIIQTTIIYAINSYLGCFIDQIGTRDLNLFISDDEQLTPTQCILACKEQNFPYAGIQYGNECRCGHYYGKYGKVSDDECIYNCTTLEKCGGVNRNSIYSVFDSIDTYPADSMCENHLMGYQGCFDESITWKIDTYVVHSIEQCIQDCAIKYDYIGIMNGNICYCGNTLDLSPSNETLCNIRCDQSSTDCCGGLHVFSVYEIKTYQSSLTNDQFQKLNRVKRAVASNDTTYFSAQTTEASSTSIAITSMSSNNSTSVSTVSVTTASLLLNSVTTNDPSTIISQLVSVTSSSSMNNTYTSVLSNVTSISSSNSVGTLITTSNINSSTASTLTDVTTQITGFTQSSVTNASNLLTITSQTVNATTASTTVSTASTTTVAATFVISTIIIVPLGKNFAATANSTREEVRQGLAAMINLGFICLANPSNSNCTQSSKRRKRQLCSAGYDVNLVSDITNVSASSTETNYKVDYSVSNLCSPNTLISPIQVKTATDSLTPTLIVSKLGYNYDGQLIRSTTIGTGQSTEPDQKLWIIGAVLGPVGFVLLLIFVFCYLHFKCRPRPGNRTLASNVSKPPPISSKSTNYKAMTNEPTSARSTTEKGIDALVKAEPLPTTTTTTTTTPPPHRRIKPTEYEKSPTQTPRNPIAVEMPMDEIRHQNDVERWRNKLRLQEKFQPSLSIKLPDSSVPNTNRSSSSQYDNQTFQQDIPIINIQPAQEVISPRRMPPRPEVEVGRSKLHRLLDDVLDKAESDESYNPDSEKERRKRRRQRRPIHSTSDDRQPLPINNTTKQIPHVPVIPQVTERPDPSITRLHYNPYEAGDRAHDLEHLKPVEFKRKYSIDEPQTTQYSVRANPPLFFDELNMADRASTATDAYANSKRIGKSRLETDREAMMRHNDGQIDQQQHHYNDDPIYNDRTFKNQLQVRNAWVESNADNDPLRLKEYRDEFKTAKKSAVNTKNIISSIQDELQHMNYPSTKDYHT